MYYKKIQKEVKAWTDYNFPQAEPWQPLLGIVEEIGEYQDSYTVLEQEDALADAMIYLIDFANKMEIDLDSDLGKPTASSYPEDYLRSMGKLSHAYLKKVQSIRTEEDHDENIKLALVNLMTRIRHSWAIFCANDSMFVDFESVFRNVWKLVSQRDWQKYKERGEQYD